MWWPTPCISVWCSHFCFPFPFPSHSRFPWVILTWKTNWNSLYSQTNSINGSTTSNQTWTLTSLIKENYSNLGTRENCSVTGDQEVKIAPWKTIRSTIYHIEHRPACVYEKYSTQVNILRQIQHLSVAHLCYISLSTCPLYAVFSVHTCGGALTITKNTHWALHKQPTHMYKIKFIITHH